MEDASLIDLIVRGASVAINVLAGFAGLMVRGRLKDKDRQIERLEERVTNLMAALEESYENGERNAKHDE